MEKTALTKQEWEALVVVLQRAPVTPPEAVLMSQIVGALRPATPEPTPNQAPEK